ncbi:Beta-1-syntrophin [Hypsibius exemplaris]|uniref:Beta-1-syntrophin n=1 Tax=Hypsibius exemplaris TaxID=2072580 RepID=A0A9X6NGK2_HYPEX|nr:Beta-1-syntrophin [Hypsibius exemplaris]
MPALRREEPAANFNAVLVLVQQQWMKALLSLEDDVLVLNFEDTYAFDDEYGDHGNRPRPNPEGFHPGAAGDSLTGQKRVVKIVKDAADGLGISIKGGRENRMPVVISKIFEDMAAYKTGQLHCGDAILSCNGFDLSNASHDDCVHALKHAGSVVILEVQFFQESGPQYRKHFALREVGWELPHGFLKDAVSCPARNLSGDMKAIPLLLCYLSRLTEQSLDADATVLLLQSPNLRQTCQLKFSDPTNGTSWFNMIHSNISSLNQKLLSQCNRVLPKVLGGSVLVTIGWMAEKVHMDGMTQLKPVFAALTDKQFMVFDSVPWTKEEWATPGFSCELIATRVLHSPTGSRNNTISRTLKGDSHAGETPITFQLRIGTRHGIEYHVFKLETCRDLSSWVKSVIQGTFRAVELTEEVSWSCSWQGHDAKLTLHFEEGFALMTGSSSRRDVFWQQPFEKLRSTADDAKRLLYLEFVDSTEPYVIDLKMSPKPAVFVIHSFLAAKLQRQGLAP